MPLFLTPVTIHRYLQGAHYPCNSWRPHDLPHVSKSSSAVFIEHFTLCYIPFFLYLINIWIYWREQENNTVAKPYYVVNHLTIYHLHVIPLPATMRRSTHTEAVSSEPSALRNVATVAMGRLRPARAQLAMPLLHCAVCHHKSCRCGTAQNWLRMRVPLHCKCRRTCRRTVHTYSHCPR